MPPDLRLVALNAKALGIWYNPQRIAYCDLLQPECTAGITVGKILVSPSVRALLRPGPSAFRHGSGGASLLRV